MSTSRRKALVVCPGRGSYNKAELGYFQRHHADKTTLMRQLDEFRQQQDQALISELDQAAIYDPRRLTRGDNASSLIYACAYADFISIDPQRFEVLRSAETLWAGILRWPAPMRSILDPP